ncbi:MAG TPA: sensor histidine kinase [Verrucomicrobiae bacterium]
MAFSVSSPATSDVAERESLPVLTNVAQIKQLKGAEATRGYPVCLRGVVTFQNLVRDAVIHDSNDGIFVARTNATFDLRQGQLVEVKGVTGLAGYAPRVEAHQILVLGSGELPAPRHLPFDWLTSGREDCQWVEVRGIVRSLTPTEANNFHVDISVEGNRLRICLMDFTIKDSSKLIDSTVRVRGVLGSSRNSRRQIVAPLLWATGNNLFFEEVPVEDAFASPVRPVSSLMRFVPETAPNHRVRVRGAVTHQNRGQSLFIRDGTRGLRLQTRETAPLKAGDVVEAVGFEGMGKYSPILQDVIYRRTGDGPPPEPITLTEERALSGDHDADLVTMEGQLLDSYQGGDDRIFVLQSDRVVFNAYLARADERHPLSIPPNGCRLKLTGICLVDEVSDNVDKLKPRLFRVLLRAAEDIVVIQKPSWWTLSRSLWALAALGILSLATSGWVISLHRRVQLQTAVISKKIQREAVLEERHRVAREIHDTLAQSYSGLGFQIESIASQVPHNAEIRERLETARQMVRHGQEEFRRSLANLRARELEHGGLPEALGELGRQMTAGSGVAFDLQIRGPTRGLDESIENNLLRISQECITNALRHANAKCISAELVFEPAHVQLRVSDDGTGFDAKQLEQLNDGHFGWRGICERAEQIQANVNLTSQPGSGTTVVVTVPTGT